MSDEKNIEIGKRIKACRKAAKMTQKELANKVGCAEITIRQYEGGKNIPKADTRIALANALGVSYADLFVPDQTPLVFDSPEEFMKARYGNTQKSKESDTPTIETAYRGEGTATNKLNYRFEANDLSEREKKVFDSLYSLLRNKDVDSPK